LADDESPGYGRPPRHSRFKPGQSGNPSGRPKGSRNFRMDLAEELNSLTTVSKNGTPLNLTKQRAIVHSIVEQAMQGDTRSLSLLLPLILKISDEVLEDEEAAVADEKIEDCIASKLKP
jgi:hypothetical protein